MANTNPNAIVNLPAPGTTVIHKLEPGEYTQFTFKLDQIDNLALRPDGSLEMKMTNGSVMIIQNFQELANSSESCGRDTVFQMLDDKVAADGAASTKIVNVSPDVLLKTLDPSLADAGTIALNAPAANMTREVMIEPGQDYKVNFDWAQAAKTIDGTNLMLSFKNGGLLVLRDFVTAMNGDLPPAMTLADGAVVDMGTLVVAACTPAATPAASELKSAASASDVRTDVANIEPAAGGHARHAAAHKVAAVAPAMNLNDIEPAAGGGNSPEAGGRGGAGFSSGIDPAGLNGLNPLGPIGPTSLNYGIPKVEDSPVRGTSTTGGDTPNDPKYPDAPSLLTEDRYVYEDSSIALSLSTTAPAGTSTTVVVSGIPAGWTVDAGLGTYDPAAGTWTITLPSGASFTGGPVVSPPANSDGDIIVLDVTATATDPTTGLSSSSTGTITVVTDAVADDPNLAASASGVEDLGADLVITTSPSDTDGSEVITAVYVRNLPTSFTLNHGVLQADGSYLLTTADLAGLKIMAPANYSGTINIQVETVVTETNLSGGEFDYTNNVATKTVDVPVTFTAVADQPCLDVQDVCVLEDGSVQLPITATLMDRDGSEYLVVKVDNIPAGWGVDANGGVYDAATRTWTITMPAGTDFTGGPILIPPTNSDVDTLDLHVTAYAYETSNGDVKSISDTANVYVDAVADMPNLTADTSETGEQDTPVALSVASSLNDTDGSEVLSIRISGLPEGATLSAGVVQEDGSYLLTPAQLAGLQVIPGTGYTGTFTLLVTATATETNLSGQECRTDNNVAERSTEIVVTITADDIPVVIDASKVIDETTLGPITVTGSVNPDFGADTGTVAARGVSSFAASGSLLAGALTHDGVAVAVTLSGNTYTGKAGDVTVFTLQVNTDGSFTFKQFENLDHADAHDANDVINLTFGVTATDNEGDATNGTITISVKDDAPVANDDLLAAKSGNVIANDVVGQDNPGTITAVSFGSTSVNVPTSGTITIAGLYGVLTIAATGVYTYVGNNGANGTDAFTYTLKDRDGDTDTATLSIQTTDGQPCIGDDAKTIDETNLGPITVTGSVNHNYGTDGAGTITAQGASSFSSGGSKLGGVLTHDGVAVSVTLVGDTYTGKAGDVTVFTCQVNADGSYTYKQFENLDHADATNPNDIITLNFGVMIADADGDTDTGTITISVKDDAPVANDDLLAAKSGNVIANDVVGQDNPGTITAVSFGSTSVNVPTSGTITIAGLYGVLTIAATGVYTYVGNNGANGTDAFTYTLKDRDGDTDTATLSIQTTDGHPCIGDDAKTVDETNLGPITVTGSVTHTYGTDGAGTITAQGASSFSSGGSKLGGVLTHDGVAVSVTLVGDTYTGKAGDVTVFTCQVNADGSYTYKQFENLDHADATNPNDIITLNFGVKIADADGDTDTGTITISVKDDAPIACDDTQCSTVPGEVLTGNVLTNDHVGADNPGTVTEVLFNGHTYAVAAQGQTEIKGTYGTLLIESDGDYSYAANASSGECVRTTATFDPSCYDVQGYATSVEINGITVSSYNPHTGGSAGDLTWVDTWGGSSGIGVAGNGESLVSTNNEGLRISLDTAAYRVDFTLGDLYNEIKNLDSQIKVYIEGSSTPVVMELPEPNSSNPSNGVHHFTLLGSDFGGDITKVEITFPEMNDGCPPTSWVLLDVIAKSETFTPGETGQDQFTYTVIDNDHDADQALLTLCAIGSSDETGCGDSGCHTTCANVVQFDDCVSTAINDFVSATSTESTVSSTSVASQGAGYETPAAANDMLDDASRNAA